MFSGNSDVKCLLGNWCIGIRFPPLYYIYGGMTAITRKENSVFGNIYEKSFGTLPLQPIY